MMKQRAAADRHFGPAIVILEPLKGITYAYVIFHTSQVTSISLV